MTNIETEDLFGYMRSIWGRQFTYKDSDMRVWHSKLYSIPFALVKQAIDKFVENSDTDFPPNLAQVKKLSKTLTRNDRLEHVDFSGQRLEHTMTWQQWAIYKADQLLMLFAWHPQPEFTFDNNWEISRVTKARHATLEFNQVVKLIMARIPDHFADFATATSCPVEKRYEGIKKIFTEIGAVKARDVSKEIFTKVAI